MSKFKIALEYPTGVLQEVSGVRFTPTEEPVNKYVSVRGGFEYQVKNPDGSWTDTNKYTVATCASGPAVVLYDPLRDTVGVTQEFRLPAFMRDVFDQKLGHTLSRPAGRVMGLAMGRQEADETMYNAVLREAFQETNCHVTIWKTIEVFSNQAILADKIGLTIGLFDSSQGKHGAKTGLKSEGELIQFQMMPYKDFIAEAMRGNFDTIGMAGAFLLQNEREKIRSYGVVPTFAAEEGADNASLTNALCKTWQRTGDGEDFSKLIAFCLDNKVVGLAAFKEELFVQPNELGAWAREQEMPTYEMQQSVVSLIAQQTRLLASENRPGEKALAALES